MKKIKVMICMCICILAIGAFAACGNEYSDSEFLGKWKCTTGEMSGVEINADEVLGGFTLELEDDGTAKTTIAGSSAKGEWEPEGDGFVIKSDNEELKFKKAEDGAVKVEYQGVTINFEKE